MVLKSQVLLLWMDAKILAIGEHNVVEGSQHNKKQNLAGPTSGRNQRIHRDAPRWHPWAKIPEQAPIPLSKQQLPRNDGSNVLFSSKDQTKTENPNLLYWSWTKHMKPRVTAWNLI